MRVAQANGTKLHVFTQLSLSHKAVWNTDVDRGFDDALLAQCSLRSTFSVERLQLSTLRRFEGNLFHHLNPNGISRWILPLGVYHRTRRRPSLLYCPQCLASDDEPHFRVWWRLSFSICCLKHHCYLQEACPHCHAPVVFQRGHFGKRAELNTDSLAICWNCRGDLCEVDELVAASARLVAYQEKLHTAALGLTVQVGQREVVGIEYANVMYQMLKLTCFTQKAERGQLRGVILRKRKLTEFGIPPEQPPRDTKIFDYLSLQERGAGLVMASSLFDSWPREFIRVFKSANLSASRITRDMNSIPEWFQFIVDKHFAEYNASSNFYSYWDKSRIGE